MPANTTIFPAKKIITMDPGHPTATAVAVRDGRILGIGGLDELQSRGPCTVDDTFAAKVLIPGLVEGHSHLLEGGMWNHTYVGFHDRRGPDGTLWKGLTSVDRVITRLREVRAADEPLLAWGFDPVLLPGQFLTARELDRVSTTRPIVVLHANVHLMTVNTAMMQLAGITAATRVEGVALGPDGEPNGELQEMAAMFLVFRVLGRVFFTDGESEAGIWNFGRVAQIAGVTCATDLTNDLSDKSIANLSKVTSDPHYPVRLVPALLGLGLSPGDGIAAVRRATAANTDKLRFGIVKLMTDGSIQGFTARLKWPGYYNGKPNGMWNIAPDQLKEVLAAYHSAGLQVHIHANGDEASEVTLEAIEAALSRHPRWDHRHTLQHCQMADASQLRRMATMGVCANFFSNHIYYWGDVHYAQTMGPERASRMDAAGTAKRLRVPFSIHSDAPITPIGPLFTAWCAVNRRTASGRLLGEAERISVEDALHAITIGAAYTLRLDHEIGSIEVGKRADFAVLEDDPLAVAPERLKEIRIWGTVLGGAVFRSPLA